MASQQYTITVRMAHNSKNLRDEWWKSMTQMHENIVGIDAAIFMHPTMESKRTRG